MYYVYILECSDTSFYTGIAKDVFKRLKEHNETSLGAKYTKYKRPLKLVYFKPMPTRSDASKEEYRIKKLTRSEKKEIIRNFIF
jgi:putative endonuclease